MAVRKINIDVNQIAIQQMTVLENAGQRNVLKA